MKEQRLYVGSIIILGTTEAGKTVWNLPGGITATRRHTAIQKARALHYKATGQEIPYPVQYLPKHSNQYIRRSLYG